MAERQARRPMASAVETRYLLMPDQANPYGTAFGGAIMGWIDMVASMAAQRHAGREVVTASIDSLSFAQPIYVGDHVVLQACVNYVGHTSMEVGVRVLREDPYTGKQTRTTTAHLTFVALDEQKRPAEVPALLPQTTDEKRWYEHGRLRVESRKALLAKMKEKVE